MMVGGRLEKPCDNCDYDLEGVTDCCPECGRPLELVDIAPLRSEWATTSQILGWLAIASSPTIVFSGIGGLAATAGLLAGLAALTDRRIAPRLRRRAAVGVTLCTLSLMFLSALFTWAFFA